MEGLSLRQALLPVSSLAVGSSSSATFVPSRTFRFRKGAAVPFAGRTSLKLRCSPALKVHASKKTFSSFDDMIRNSKVPVLVDFYATWCGPCQLMTPILKDVGAALKDRISVVKVDTEKYPNVASRYGIQALPTFVLFVNGEPIDFMEGAQPKDKLINHIIKTLDAEKAKVQL